jgi:DNA-3-methyladenine glycosylase
MRLGADFYARSTLEVARDLLGKYVVSRRGRRVRAGRIVETEAYRGVEDRACHGSRGLTRRTATLFGPPGRAYVFLIYGMYHCLNAVTEVEGVPAAVLLRALESSELPPMDGPGKLCRVLEYAGEWALKPWRFFIEGSPAVSRARPVRRAG